MTLRALVIEDDPHIKDVVTDIVESLGHEFDAADCQEEARRLLATTEYDYFLLDLEIPVKPDRSIARLQNGLNLLDELVSLFGRQSPVIVMTAHCNDGPNQGVECLKMGAADYVAKPFPRTGKTLDGAINEALSRAGRLPAKSTRRRPSSPPRPFAGGEIRLLKRRLIVCDVEVQITPLMHRILTVLNSKHGNGRYVALAGSELADHDAVRCNRGQNGISEAIHSLRKRITTKVREEGNVEIGDQDIVRSKGEGYRIHESVTVTTGARKSALAIAGGRVTNDVPDVTDCVTTNGTNRNGHGTNVTDLNDRQEWIMSLIHKGTEVRVGMVVERFKCSPRTAKRDLAELKDKHLVRFVGSPRTGHYRLM